MDIQKEQTINTDLLKEKVNPNLLNGSFSRNKAFLCFIFLILRVYTNKNENI